MKLEMNFAQTAILNRGGINHLRLDLTPPVSVRDVVKKPILFIIVLDKSGSMSESVDGTYISLNNSVFGGRRAERKRTKMEHSIEATLKFIQFIREDDLFGIVTFDDYADITQEVIKITSENRTIIEEKIKDIKTRNSTNISLALQRARDMITPYHKENYNCKIVVISDGQANAGLKNADNFSSLALQYLEEGITLSALGIGSDYNSNIMNAIATGGGGLFWHVEDIEKLSDVFAQELSLSTMVTAKKVKLMLEIPELIEISENMNDYKQVVNGNYIEVYLGDMYAERSIYFELRNNFVDNDIVLNAKVVYETLDNNNSTVSVSKQLRTVLMQEELNEFEKNQAIIDSVISLLKNKTIRETSNQLENGRTSDVTLSFCNAMSKISDVSTMYCCCDSLETQDTVKELDVLRSTYVSGNVTKGFLKSKYAESNRTMREQK